MQHTFSSVSDFSQPSKQKSDENAVSPDTAGLDLIPDSIAAVSGGPDSMAMLDWMRSSGFHPAVCHVNYHKRPTASRDEAIVRAYCEKFSLPLLVLHPYNPKGNFQSWAREVRYDFFARAARLFQIKKIYVAHQQDDLIETWMIQKQRHALTETIGLKESVYRQDLEIVRPMLHFSKSCLEQYCLQHQIPYGIDESNLENGYLRNRLRHTAVESLTTQERAKILERIHQEERENQQRHRHAQFLSQQNASAILTDPDGWMALDQLLHEKTGTHFGKKRLCDLQEKLQHRHTVKIQDWMIEVHHNAVLLERDIQPVPFYIESCAQLEAMCIDQYVLPGYGIRFSESGKTIERIALDEQDFPLIIRPPKNGDAIAMRFGTKKVSRFLIDRQIPQSQRKRWPLVQTAEQKIAFVNGLGCGAAFFTGKHLFYMLELTLSDEN